MPVARKRAALAALVLCLGSGASAAPKRWFKARSANFELFTSSGERRARSMILHFEQVRSFFLKVNRSRTPEPGEPVRIVLFSSEKEYKPYQVSETAAAFYAQGHDRDHIVMHSGVENSDRIAVHEFVHLLMKNAKAPLWLEEGMAELYSTLRPVGSKVQIGEIIPGRYMVLQREKWLTLEQLTAVDHSSPIYTERDHAGIFYAESWALVHMLVLNNEYRLKFPDLTGALLAGASHDAAFQKAYGKRLWEMWTELKDYMRQFRFNVGLFDIKLEKAAEQPAIAEAEPLETALVLAGLFAATRKPEDARRAYEELAAANPKDPRVPEHLGYLSLRMPQREEARRHFARAVALGSANPQLHFDYAMVLHETGASDAEVVTVLRKAVELRPEFPEAHRQLGFLLLKQQKYEEAVNSLLQVRQVKREQAFALFSALAYAYARLGNREEGRKAVEKARQFASGTAERRRAEELLRYVEEPIQVVEEEDAPKRLVRRPQPMPVEEPAPAHPSVEGVLDIVECRGNKAVLKLRVAGRPWRLAILDPKAVIIQGAGSGTFEFTCGPQKARQLVIEYQPVFNTELGTQGNVISIRFK